MISYEPLWDTMKEQGISTYALIEKHKIPAKTIYNLKHQQNVTTHTLQKLCNVLNVTSDKIVKIYPD